MKRWVPWWARIAAKLMLSRMPAGYGLWRRLNLFVHGAMQDISYAERVFQQHFGRCSRTAREQFVALELGPGDSLLSAVLAAAHGAKHTYLVDVGPFASSDLSIYRDMALQLRKTGLPAPDLSSVSDISQMLTACRASYSTFGLSSLRAIPSASVDFIWSHAVLEHVRRNEFNEFAHEMRRILSDRGVCSHQVDLKDHLGGALNNMRIPSKVWEAEWMARSGFYTNRLRQSEIVRAFRDAGFGVTILSSNRWDTPPIPRTALAREFQHLERDDLSVKGFEILLIPETQPAATGVGYE